MKTRRVMLLTRRFLLAAFVAVLAPLVPTTPALAADTVIDIHPGTGADAVRGVRNPQTVLDRGGTVDGLPIRRGGGGVAVLPWTTIKHLIFIPGDSPTVVIKYRDGSETMLDVEPCRIVAGDMNIDIHDVAEIVLR
jgi:hypothetical protein